MYRLHCVSQSYGWGKVGAASQVAQLAAGGNEHMHIDAAQPYAELWMGTHVKGASRLAHDGRLLSEWLGEHRATLGDNIAVDGTHLQLPFLFKVLSVNKALSIQSHPTKEQAIVLHAADPANYPDANHKPEMAIALTPFEMMCGFRPADDILQNIRETPELFELVGGVAFTALERSMSEGDEAARKTALRACFTQLMHQPAALVSKNIASLVERIALHVRNSAEPTYDAASGGSGFVLGELIIRLNYHFAGDIGCFAPFFLNHFVLQPGEASFLAPNEPHAYLYGDCMECMACSDNTIRAGLTPKYKDVDTLCSSLTYRMSPVSANKLASTRVDEVTTAYCPPTDEFAVHRLAACAGGVPYTLPSLPTCSLMIVIEGGSSASWGAESLQLCKGSVVYVSANTSITLASDDAFVAYRAFKP